MKTIREKIAVPIYNVDVFVVVTDDAAREQKRLKRVFGEDPDTNYAAICAYSGTSRFGLLFKSDEITLTVVAHEVFHLTHRIMEYTSINFDKDNSEPGAFLNGFLLCSVYGIVKKRLRKR